MKAILSKLIRRLCLLVVSISFFFSQGCSQASPTPIPTRTLPPPPTNPPQQAQPTATAIVPTATIPAPTSTPPTATNPEGALVRLNFGSVEQIALSPDGEWLVAAGTTHLCMYDTAGYKQVWCEPATLPTELERWGGPEQAREKFVRRIVFRPDGSQIVYALWYGGIVFLDSTTGQRLHVIDSYPQNSIMELVWSQDNNHLFIWSFEDGLDIWNVAADEKVGHLEIDPAQIKSVAWTPDGNKAAVSLVGDRIISLWDMTTFKQSGSFDTELPDYGYKLAWSPSGTILYASVYNVMGNCGADQGDKGWIKAWDITTNKLIFETDMHGACMQSMSVSPDGHRLGAITGYGRLVVLDASTGNIEIDRQISDLKSLVWWGNDRMLVVHYPSSPYGSGDLKSIGELDLNTKEMMAIFLPGFDNIYSLAWLPNSERLVTNSAGGRISIWDAPTGQRQEQFQLSLRGVSLTSFDPASISPVDGTLAIPAQHSVATVNLETRQVLQIMEYDVTWADTHAATTRWSGDGKRLAAQVYDLDFTNIVVWEASTGKVILTIPFERQKTIRSLALSPDGKLLAVSEWSPGKYRLLAWDIEANKEIASIETPNSALEISWINQDQVALTSHGWIEIYDVTNGTKVRTLAEGYTYAVSPDGSLVAAEQLRKGITISDFHTGKEIAKLHLEPVFVNRMAISPDGKLLAALTEFGSLIIWDISGYY